MWVLHGHAQCVQKLAAARGIWAHAPPSRKIRCSETASEVILGPVARSFVAIKSVICFTST